MLFSSPRQPKLARIGKDGDDEDFVKSSESYAIELREYYDARAHQNRLRYRVSGILVIIGGSALPVLSTQQFANRDLVVSLVGVGISAITALRAFYRWDSAWILLRNTEAKASKIYLDWKAKYNKYSASQNKVLLRKSTAEMIDQLMELRGEESSSFFRDLPFPH